MDTDTTEATTMETWASGEALIVVPERLMKNVVSQVEARGRVKPGADRGAFRAREP